MVSQGRLHERVAVITGAANGIGEAAARLCVAEGARVVLVDRDAPRLEALQSDLGEKAAASLVADVADHDTATRYVTLAQERFGRLDVVLLNAGMAGTIAPIHRVTPEDFDRILAVNVRSVWSGMAAAFLAMKSSGGSIVVTASTGGLMGAQQVAPYIASKHAVIGLVKSAAIEGARFGIRVNAVAPAPIDTAMMQHINQGLGAGDAERSRARTIAHVPLQRFGTPEEVARMMVFLASGEAGNCTGGTYLLDGGMGAGIYQ